MTEFNQLLGLTYTVRITGRARFARLLATVNIAKEYIYSDEDIIYFFILYIYLIDYKPGFCIKTRFLINTKFLLL